MPLELHRDGNMTMKLLVATLLHDIGLIDQHKTSNCQCFTLNSAMQAEQLCKYHHYPKEKTDLIADAILTSI
jgi:predicted HD phosphohydrolase